MSTALETRDCVENNKSCYFSACLSPSAALISAPQSQGKRLEQGELSWQQQQQQWQPCHFESPSAPPRGGVGPGIHSQEQEVLFGESLKLRIDFAMFRPPRHTLLHL